MANYLLQETVPDKLLQEDGTGLLVDSLTFFPNQHKRLTGGGATTTVGSYDTLPVIGNLLVAGVVSGGLAGSPICTGFTDNQGHTWTEAGTFQKIAGEEYVQIFYVVPTASSGTYTITATFTGVSQSNTIGIHEYTGNTTPVGSVLDQTTKATGTSLAPASGTLTPTLDGSLIFAVEVDDVTTDNALVTQGTDFTLRITELVISTNERYADEDYIQPAKLIHNGDFSITENVNWGAKIAIFKPFVASVGAVKLLALLGCG